MQLIEFALEKNNFGQSARESAEKGRLGPKPWFLGAAGVQGLAATVASLDRLPIFSDKPVNSEALAVFFFMHLFGGMVPERNGALRQLNSCALMPAQAAPRANSNNVYGFLHLMRSWQHTSKNPPE